MAQDTPAPRCIKLCFNLHTSYHREPFNHGQCFSKGADLTAKGAKVAQRNAEYGIIYLPPLREACSLALRIRFIDLSRTTKDHKWVTAEFVVRTLIQISAKITGRARDDNLDMA